MTPAFRGALETDDGALVLFSWRGYGRDGILAGSMSHLSGDARYSWLNDRVCAVTGSIRPHDGGGFEVVLEVAALIPEG